jgi:hypothetical protein
MTYKIDLTDPLHGEFVVFPKTTNAPPAANAKTALNVYGKGSLNWGEGVNENFLHLLEKFAGATPPANPLIGQLWFCIRYYKHNTGIPDTWWRYNPTTDNWDSLAVPTAAPLTPDIGDYWLDNSTGILYRWDRLTQAQDENNNYLHVPTWNQRYYLTFADDDNNPPGGDPTKSMYVWNGIDWTVTASILAQGLPPPDAITGTLWYDTTNKRLFMWDAGLSQWLALFLTTSTSSMEGDFDANGNEILGVADPLDDTDGANLNYLVGSVSIGTIDVNNQFSFHIGDLTKHLTQSQNVWLDVVATPSTGVTAAEVNRLVGLNFNLQQRIDQLMSGQQATTDTKVNKSGDIMTGPLKVASYNSGITSPEQQAIQKQYFDANWKLKDLLDVDGNAVGDGDVLKWNGTKWAPAKVTNTITIDVIGTPTSLSAGGAAVSVRGYVVDSGGIKTDITSASGSTWSLVSGGPHVTMAGTAPKTLTAQLGTPANTTAKIKLVYNDGTTTKSVVRSFNVVTVFSVAVSGPPSVRHNQAVSYTASANLSDGSVRPNIQAVCAWEFPLGTSRSSSFTVPTSVPIGTQTIKATYTGSGYSGTQTVSVAAGATGITIGGPTTVYEGGYTIALTASVSFTSGSPVVVTSSSSWAVISGPGSINSSGVYTSPANVSGNTNVTIQVTNTAYGTTLQTTRTITVVERPASGSQGWSGPTSGSFTVPATYSNITIEAVAGGGGGGGGYGNSGNNNGAGQGGGAGQYFIGNYNVPAGSVISFNVGAGGTPGTKSSVPGPCDGTAGGNTTITGPGISIGLTGGCGGWGSYGTGGPTAFYSRDCTTNNSCASSARPFPDSPTVGCATGGNGQASSYPGSTGGPGGNVWSFMPGVPNEAVVGPIPAGTLGGGGGGGGVCTSDPNDTQTVGGYGGNGYLKITWNS